MMSYYFIVALMCPLTYLVLNSSIGLINKRISTRLFLFGYGIFLILFTGLRFSKGLSVDYGNYMYIYQHSAFASWKDSLDPFQLENKGQIIFSTLNKTIGELSNYNVIWYMLIISLLTVVPLFSYFYKNSMQPWLCVLLLVTVGSYWTSFNTLRQFLAASFFVFSFRYIQERKFMHFFCVLVIATLIHWSSIVMIVLYWVLNIDWDFRKKWNTLFKAITMLLIILTMTYLITLTSVTSVLSDNYLIENNSSLVNLLRPAMLFFFNIICFFNKNTFNKSDKLGFNCALLYFGLSMSSVVSGIFVRYTYFLICPLIVSIVNNIWKQKRNVKLILLSSLIILVLMYSFYSTLNIEYDFFWNDPVLWQYKY